MYIKSRMYGIFLENFKKYFDDLNSTTHIGELAQYLQHGSTSRFLHSAAVAYYSYRLALFLGVTSHTNELIRAALMHDYYLYDSKDGHPSRRGHGRRHPSVALENAEAECFLTDIERDIISTHMFPVTFKAPVSSEASIVCFVDKACAVYEFFKRRNPYRYLNTLVVRDQVLSKKRTRALKGTI